ncbi:MAG: D-sedoheptulose 7-phosphate isomerase [Candidatus Omnitrophica bacterium]|nr:D-sedoheptulose 7-phosphate isomerase [Candidatus Omnitrophota bacterium]
MRKIFAESIAVKESALEGNITQIVKAVKKITAALKSGNKILFFGNGGSASDSQHMAAEFIGRFKKERKALPAIALTTDTSVLTSLSNDYNFDIVFERQIEALGKKGDIALGISTSGNSANVVSAIKKAVIMGLYTISLTGNKGGKLLEFSDITIIVPSPITARVQEAHSVILHAICELVEESI